MDAGSRVGCRSLRGVAQALSARVGIPCKHGERPIVVDILSPSWPIRVMMGVGPRRRGPGGKQALSMRRNRGPHALDVLQILRETQASMLIAGRGAPLTEGRGSKTCGGLLTRRSDSPDERPYTYTMEPCDKPAASKLAVSSVSSPEPSWVVAIWKVAHSGTLSSCTSRSSVFWRSVDTDASPGRLTLCVFCSVRIRITRSLISVGLRLRKGHQKRCGRSRERHQGYVTALFETRQGRPVAVPASASDLNGRRRQIPRPKIGGTRVLRYPLWAHGYISFLDRS
eukprot:scaffold8474_cov258-Pinguiococcus_pyrenoidosus.AAC.2